MSYGTAVAQTYAAAHPDRLAGLVLDGTIDLTLTGEQSSLAQEKAFDEVLVAVFEACDEDEACGQSWVGMHCPCMIALRQFRIRLFMSIPCLPAKR